MALDVAKVKAHLDRLRALVPDEPAWWRTGPVWSDDKLAAFESAQGFELPEDYRTWLREIGDGGAGFLAPADGFVSLARFPPNRDDVTKPFRIAKRASKVSYPISGVIYLGEHVRHRAFLVVRGKHAGEVWIDRTAKRDGAFAAEGTFAELTEQWIAGFARAWAKRTAADTAKQAAAADAEDSFERWRRLCGDLVAWLRSGTDPFVETFDQIAIGRQRDAMASFTIAIGQHVDRWLFDPRLAPTAALVLTTCLDRVNAPRTRVEQALAAISDHHDPVDMAPQKIAELFDACAASATYEDAHLFAFERVLRAAGRLDEAIRAFRTRTIYQKAEYVELALALIAAGRAGDAVAVGEELARSKGVMRDFDWALGWVLVAAGRYEEGCKKLALFVANQVDTSRQQIVARLHRDPKTPLPDDLAFVAYETPPIPLHAMTAPYELVALLYAIADEGPDALDAAIRALSYVGLKRYHPQEHVNHLASFRIGQALTGQTPAPEPPIVADYSTTATHRLAERVLAGLPSIGVTLKYRQRYR